MIMVVIRPDQRPRCHTGDDLAPRGRYGAVGLHVISGTRVDDRVPVHRGGGGERGHIALEAGRYWAPFRHRCRALGQRFGPDPVAKTTLITAPRR